jgi:hypothetical protein
MLTKDAQQTDFNLFYQKQKIQLLSPFINEKRMIQNAEENGEIFYKII